MRSRNRTTCGQGNSFRKALSAQVKGLVLMITVLSRLIPRPVTLANSSMMSIALRRVSLPPSQARSAARASGKHLMLGLLLSELATHGD